jgi:lysine-N-methylase
MARSNKALKIIYPEGQKYACRDCPARCCTSSWGIPVTKEECERIMSDDEARERLGWRGEAILRAGVLPMREKDERLACVFLDEDLLCSLHKKHGHAFIPAPCQAFPFGFSSNEKQEPVALLSRYCPSIRDNYGEPVENVIAEKLEQAGGARPLGEKMGLRSGRVLPRSQYVPVIERWKQLLIEVPSVANSLTQIFDFTDALDGALPTTKRPSDKELQTALRKANELAVQPLIPGGLKFGGKMLVAHLLGGICYPSRVMLAHRMTPIRFWEKVQSWMNRISWLFSLGTVKLLFVDLPVKVSKVRGVRPFLAGPQGRLVSEYLSELVDRRQGMSHQTYLHRVIVDMALMAALISRYARAAASAEGLTEVEARHVREGIGVAELLFSHQGDSGQSAVLHQLRLTLMSNRDDFRRLLAAEI